MKSFVFALFAAFTVLSVTLPPAFARGPVGEITLTQLPKEAHETLALIKKGGPYPYKQDDGVFGNREGLLPQQPRGSYREYTVKTPGSRDRGARRIVVAKAPPAVAGGRAEFYYTDDHYNSFRRIRE